MPRSEWYQYSQRSQWSSFSRKLGASLWTNGSATNCSSQPLTRRCGSRSCRDSGPQTLHLYMKSKASQHQCDLINWWLMCDVEVERVQDSRKTIRLWVLCPTVFQSCFLHLDQIMGLWNSIATRQVKTCFIKKKFLCLPLLLQASFHPSTVPILVQPVLSSLMAAARDFESRVALWCCCLGCLDLLIASTGSILIVIAQLTTYSRQSS